MLGICCSYGWGLYHSTAAGMQWRVLLVLGSVVVTLEWISITSLRRRCLVTDQLEAQLRYQRVRMWIKIVVFGSLFLVALMVAPVR